MNEHVDLNISLKRILFTFIQNKSDVYRDSDVKEISRLLSLTWLKTLEKK